jgi:hypothetical protein
MAAASVTSCAAPGLARSQVLKCFRTVSGRPPVGLGAAGLRWQPPRDPSLSKRWSASPELSLSNPACSCSTSRRRASTPKPARHSSTTSRPHSQIVGPRSCTSRTAQRRLFGSRTASQSSPPARSASWETSAVVRLPADATVAQADRLRQRRCRRDRPDRTCAHRRRPLRATSRHARCRHTGGTGSRHPDHPAWPWSGPGQVERVSPGPGRWELILSAGETLRAHLPLDEPPPRSGRTRCPTRRPSTRHSHRRTSRPIALNLSPPPPCHRLGVAAAIGEVQRGHILATAWQRALGLPDAGLAKAPKIVDSTLMLGAAAVQDSATLVRSGVRRLLEAVGASDGEAAAELASGFASATPARA